MDVNEEFKFFEYSKKKIWWGGGGDQGGCERN